VIGGSAGWALLAEPASREGGQNQDST